MRLRIGLVLVSMVGLLACRDAGRAGNRPLPPKSVDSGQPADSDAGSDADSGFVDSGSPFVDAGFVDSGTPPPADAGFADTGVVPDAGPVPGTLTVYDLQDPSRPGYPGLDQPVRLANVVVSAVAPSGNFWVQEQAGGPYSGVLIYKPAAVPPTGVQVGDRVSLSGSLTEFFDLTEVVLSTLDTAVPGTPPAPITVAATDLANGSPAAEQWEGVLVRVDGVRVLDDMPDAPDDFGEWVVTGGLRIDDMIFAMEPRPAVGTTFTAIIGVHNYGFENFKIEPRSAADFVP